jgi:2-phosphoglycerate kinase
MTPTVVLLGGNSGSGKSMAGEALARAMGFQLASVDDFRLLLQRVATADHLVPVHRFFADIDHLGAEEMTSRYQAVAAVVSSALEIVVANHISTGAPIVLEGDTLLPAMVAKQQFVGAPAEGVRAAFLIENDGFELRRRIRARARGGTEPSNERSERDARFSLAYGAWLEKECHRLAVPVVRPEPFATVVERLRDAIGQ